MKKLKARVENIHLRKAMPELMDKIVRDFTSTVLNPFQPQRFPPEVEAYLRAALFSGIISPGRLLTEYVIPDGETVAFTLTECSDFRGVTVLLAGVWPAFRGRGVFRDIIENIALQAKAPVAVLCHPDMSIAIRQIGKLGYRPQKAYSNGYLYVRQSLPDARRCSYRTA